MKIMLAQLKLSLATKSILTSVLSLIEDTVKIVMSVIKNILKKFVMTTTAMGKIVTTRGIQILANLELDANSTERRNVCSLLLLLLAMKTFISINYSFIKNENNCFRFHFICHNLNKL